MSKTLTEQDFQTAANKLKCEIAAIKAVAEVESKGKGFYSNGFPVILFERHKFHKYSGGKFDKSHPHLSNAKAGGYGPAGANQQRKFNEAFALDPNAALLSCSWGKFQIMGFNYKVCGFASVNEFVDAMKESEGAQLLAFVNFVIGNHLAVYLRNKNWAKFAEGYNGEDYAKNDYDTKMATAYDKYLKNPVKTAKPETQTLPETTKVEISDGEVKVETSTNPPTENTTEIVTAPPKENSTATATKATVFGIAVPAFVGVAIKAITDLISQGFISAAQIGEFVLNLIKENQKYVLWIVIALILLLGIKKLCKQITLWLQMYFAGSKDHNNVEVKPQ
jgi:hypothetical protein